ncbi:Tyrosine recombinase XerC [Labrys miyagiensis]
MSVYRNTAKSPFYQYDFQWRGHRFHGSTGKKDRRAAEAWEKAEKERVKRSAARGADRADAMTFDIAAGRYWDEKGQHSKERDLEEVLALLIERIGPETRLSEIDDELLTRVVSMRKGDFRMGKSKLGLVSNRTVNRTVTELLRRILTRARKLWKISLPDEPDYTAHKLDEGAERVRELGYGEEAKVEAEERDDYRPIRLFAQASGLRKANLLLTWAQVDWGAGVIRVVQKGDKPHVVPITPEISEILWPLRGHHETFVFTFVAQRSRRNPKSGREYRKGRRYPITYEGLSTAFGRTRKKAALVDFKFHDLRHTALTRTLRASKNLRAVKELAGHSDIKTTMRYAHAMTEDVAEAMSARPADEAARRAEFERRQKAADAKEPQKVPEKSRNGKVAKSKK